MEGVPESLLAPPVGDGPPTLLRIFLVRARGLPVMDQALFGGGGSSDPRVTFRLGGQARTSTCKRKCLEPEWLESFELPCDDGADALTVTVDDVDVLKNDFMGAFQLQVASLADGAPRREWHALADAKGRAGALGEVELVLRWIHDEVAALRLPAAFCAAESAAAQLEAPNALKILLLRAKNLAIMDKNLLSAGGSSDPVVTFALGGAAQIKRKGRAGLAAVVPKERVRKSTVKKHDLAPIWIEAFDVGCEGNGLVLEVSVDDVDVVGTDFMGRCWIRLDDVLPAGRQTHRAWHALCDEHGVECAAMGKVEVALRRVHDEKRFLKVPDDFHKAETAAHLAEEPNSLQIYLIRADDLPIMDKNLLSSGGSSDPVATFAVGESRCKSTVKKKTLAPQWLETFELPCEADDGALTVAVDDHDFAGSDQMGHFTIDLAALEDRRVHRAWYALTGVAQGRVELALRWIFDAARATPLPDSLTREYAPRGEKNTLKVYLIRAKGLSVMDRNVLSGGGSSDPVVTLSVKESDGALVAVSKSSVKKRSLAPRWLEEFSLAADDAAQVLHVVMEDHDLVGAKFMGSHSIDVAALAEGAAQRLWLELRNGGGRVEVALRWVYDAKNDLPLPPNFAAVDDNARAPNALKIFLLRARGLAIKDRNLLSAGGSSDPFVTFEVLGAKVSSTTKKKTLTPLWAEAFELGADEGVVKVAVWDHDEVTDNDFMGEFHLDVAALAGGAVHRQWHALHPKGQKVGQKGAGKPEALGKVELALRWSFDPKRDLPLPAKMLEAEAQADRAPNCLSVFLIRGRGLPVMDKALWGGGSSDPMASLALRGSGRRVSSNFKAKTLHPVWMQQFDVEAEEGVLDITVEDHDEISENDLMGTVAIDLDDAASPLNDRQVHRAWHLLARKGASDLGKIELGLRLWHNPDFFLALPDSMTAEEPADALAKGTNALTVFLIRARGLAVKDRNLLSKGGSSDPMVSFEVQGETAVSSHKPKTLAPVWMEHFALAADEGVLAVRVDDFDVVGVDFMGSCAVELAPLADRRPHRQWHTLAGRGGGAAGKVELGLRWRYDAAMDVPLPESFMSGGANGADADAPANCLKIFVVRGRGIFNKAGHAVREPTVALTLQGAKSKEKQLALVAKKSAALSTAALAKPVFARDFEVRAEFGSLHVRIASAGLLGAEEALGGFSVDLLTLTRDRLDRRWFDLQGGRGQIELALKWVFDVRYETPLPPAMAAGPDLPKNVVQVFVMSARPASDAGFSPAPAQLRVTAALRSSERARRTTQARAHSAAGAPWPTWAEVLELDCEDASEVLELFLHAADDATAGRAAAAPSDAAAAPSGAAASTRAVWTALAADGAPAADVGDGSVAVESLADGAVHRRWRLLGGARVEVAIRWVHRADRVSPVSGDFVDASTDASEKLNALRVQVLRVSIGRSPGPARELRQLRVDTILGEETSIAPKAPGRMAALAARKKQAADGASTALRQCKARECESTFTPFEAYSDLVPVWKSDRRDFDAKAAFVEFELSEMRTDLREWRSLGHAKVALAEFVPSVAHAWVYVEAGGVSHRIEVACHLVHDSAVAERQAWRREASRLASVAAAAGDVSTLENRLAMFTAAKGKLNLQGLGLSEAPDATLVLARAPSAVRGLALNDNCLVAWPASLARRLPTLRLLNLARNRLGAAGLFDVDWSALAQLASLCLDGNALADFPWAAACAQLQSLEFLSLCDNALRGFEADVGHLAALQELRMHTNALRADACAFGALETLAAAHRLSRLDLRRNGFAVESLSTTLRALHAVDADVERDAIRHAVDVNRRVQQRLHPGRGLQGGAPVPSGAAPAPSGAAPAPSRS